MRLVDSALSKAGVIVEAWQASAVGAFAFAWLNHSSWAALQYEYRLMVIAFLMVAVDTITGVAAAKHRGDPISSSVARRVLEKMIGYGATVLAVWGICEVVRAPQPIASLSVAMALGAIVAIEALSVLENVAKLNIKRLGPLLRWVRRLLNRELEQFSDDKDLGGQIAEEGKPE